MENTNNDNETNETTEVVVDNCPLCLRENQKLHSCELCEEYVCKRCFQILAEERFAFDSALPESLKKSRYCQTCYDQTVAPFEIEYEASLEAAKNLIYISKRYRKLLPVLKKAKTKIFVSNCRDMAEVRVKLAFQAVKLGFNSIIEAEVDSKKHRDHGYQKMIWSGEALPAQIDIARFDRFEANDQE